MIERTDESAPLDWESTMDSIDFRAAPQSKIYLTEADCGLAYDVFEYYPDAHFENGEEENVGGPGGPSLDELVGGDRCEDQIRFDGGRYTDTYFAWYDPDTDAFLYHTEANGEFADPFFETEAAAHEFLEKRVGEGEQCQYENLSLQKLRGKKIGEAVEVLTDQAGIGDFLQR